MTYTPFDLTGKVALVTGGNRGIGLGMADALARSGADIAIWGTNAGRNAEAAETLRAHGVRVHTDAVNVADERAVNAAMAGTIAALGRVDAVFANAGIGSYVGSFLDLTGEELRKVLAVNVDGLIFTLREGARHMVERAKAGDKGGSLVGIASIASIEGAARNQHYAASKGAVLSVIKATAVEFARHGIRANAILPGWIATDMTSLAQENPAFAEKVIPRVPMRRWGKPADFGGIAVYLASDASAFHTGDTLIVDGGYTCF